MDFWNHGEIVRIRQFSRQQKKLSHYYLSILFTVKVSSGGLVGQPGGVQGNQTILQSALSQPQVIKGVSWFK